jgi:two-component system phosphate regulon response regulator PhoB
MNRHARSALPERAFACSDRSAKSSDGAGGAGEETLAVGDILMNLTRHRVYRAGRPVHLGPLSYRLLRCLMEHPGEAMSRRRLLQTLWQQSGRSPTRTVDVHVYRLRAALNEAGERNVIHTVRGVGYRLSP